MDHSKWTDRQFLSQISVLDPTTEHLMGSKGGVLYLYEAKSAATAKGK